jgi:hypothetical protein
MHVAAKLIISRGFLSKRNVFFLPFFVYDAPVGRNEMG